VTYRKPLSFDRSEWPRSALDFYAERAAILAADGIPEPEKKAEGMTRIWWVNGGADLSQDW
jgi:hypothetical protein